MSSDQSCTVIPAKTQHNVLAAYQATHMNPVRFAWVHKVPPLKLISWMVGDMFERARAHSRTQKTLTTS